MENSWDETCKKWIECDPQAFVSWLTDKQAKFISMLPNELNDVSLEVDCMMRVKLHGELVILLVEVQTYYEKNMHERVHRYASEIRWRMRKKPLPILSYIIHLARDKRFPKGPLIWKVPGGEANLAFIYKCIEMQDIPTEIILNSNQPSLFPLLPLTRGGIKHDVIKYMREELEKNNLRDLEVVGLAFATLTFKKRPKDREWLRKEIDMAKNLLKDTPLWDMISSWAYEEGHEKGLEKGLEQGLEKGLEQGLKEGLEQGRKLDCRKKIHAVVQIRYPDLSQLAEQQAQLLDDITLLDHLFDTMLLANNQEEARQALLAVTQTPPKPAEA